MEKGSAMRFLYAIFFLSGAPALIYQVVWQRSLFTILGVNVESVALVVTAFMLGLGLGSLARGAISKNPRVPPLLAFAVIELSIGTFGLFSLTLFGEVPYLVRRLVSTIQPRGRQRSRSSLGASVAMKLGAS